MLQHTVSVAVECRSANDTWLSPRPAAVAVTPRVEPRLLGLPQSPSNLRPQHGGAGGVPSGTDEQQPASSSSNSQYSDEAPVAFTEIKRCQQDLCTRFDCFVSDVTARLERLERPTGSSDSDGSSISSSITTLPTIREFEEQGNGFGLIDGVISREVARQLAAVTGDVLGRAVSNASQGAFGNSIERLEETLKAEAAEHAAVSEAGLIEAKATMAASVDRIRETLQHEVDVLHKNLLVVESRFKLLERQSEQALQIPISQALLQQSPRCAAEAAAEPPRFISAPQSRHPALVPSRGVAMAQPQGAGSPRSVIQESNRNRLPQERQTLDGLQRRLAGKVSGIVSMLNQSCEANSCQNGSWNGNSSAEGGHGAAVLSRMPR